MRRRLALALPLLALVAAGPVRAQPAYEALNRSLTERVAVPAYARMAEAMASLERTTTAFCEAPGPSTRQGAEGAFHAAMEAWQRAQPFAMGPVTFEGRAARIQFWPDKGGTAARQVRRALQARNPALIAEGGLAGKSVALQNLSTYERLLFSRGAAMASGQTSEDDRYACALAAAIARFQAVLAAQIRDDWVKPGGFRDAVMTAAQGNAHFLDAKEAATAFLKSLSGTLEMAVRLKLERPLGKTIERARPKRAESWRSGRSLANIRANLVTARALYTAPDGFGELLAAAGARALDTGLRRSFEEALALADNLDRPLHEAVSDAATREQLQALLEKLRSLRVLISGPVAEEIGLVVGFNALDGD